MEASQDRNRQLQPDASWARLLRDLSRCGRLAQRALSSQLDSALSASQAALLWTCREMESHEASQLELARRMGMSPAQISSLVEELRRRELLVSERCPQDRRRQTWRLTASGQQIVCSLDEQLEAWSAACGDQLGDTTIHEMLRGLQALETLLNRLPDVPAETHVRRGAAA